MEAVYYKGTMIGDVEPSEGPYGGWWATLIDEVKDYKLLSEEFHMRKRDAVASLKRGWREYLKERKESLKSISI